MASTEAPRFESLLSHLWPTDEWQDCHAIVAVSGGADSVALLRALHSIKRQTGGRGTLYAAHVNHSLRGAAADSDQAWLEALCERIGVSLIVGRVDPTILAAEQGDGWEAAARTARYRFLANAAEQAGVRYVATAHTADDQVETILHQIMRGTGFAGLSGMLHGRKLSPSVQLVRPMLTIKRRDVIDYLADLKQDFRTDETNADRQFTRNRLRHELLPLLREQFNSDVDMALLRLGVQAAEVQHWIDHWTDQLVEKCVIVHNPPDGFTFVKIEIRPLAGNPQFIVREVCKKAWSRAGWPLQSAGFDVWQQLAALAAAAGPQPAISLPGGVQAVRDADTLVLSRPASLS